MSRGTLLVSRNTNLLPHYKARLEALDYANVTVTDKDRDALAMLINELKPRYLLISSHFYSAGTPFMVGELRGLFPDLYIAAISTHFYPDDLAAWFIFRGAKSYINLLDGVEAFRKGLRVVRNGGDYIAPNVQRLVDSIPEWPDCCGKDTRRLHEVLLMICNGYSMKCIGDNLHIHRTTVDYHLKRLFQIFSVNSREELIKTVFCLGVVTVNDLVFFERDYREAALPQWAEYKRSMNNGGNYDYQN